MAYSPIDPENLHGQLINVFHGAMAHPHVTAPRKSGYAKILAMLMQDQAQAHAGQARQPGASPGGVQQPQDTGIPADQTAGIPYLNLPQHTAGYGGLGGFQQPEPQGYGPQDLLAALRGPGG